MQNSKPNKARKDLYPFLDAVLDVSLEKFNGPTKADEDRRSWGRLINSTVHEYGFLLKDEELELRVEALEKRLENAVLIPRGDQPK
jgi:hypothetical protein